MLNKRISITIVIAALILFIAFVDLSIDEQTKKVESEEKDLTVEEINAKYEKQREEIDRLVVTSFNKVVLEEFKKDFSLNLKGYKFKGIDTFSEKVLTAYFSENTYHPRFTFAYIKDNKGYILDKNPDSGKNRLLFINYINAQWELNDTKRMLGDKYTADFISTIEEDIRKKYKK